MRGVRWPAVVRHWVLIYDQVIAIHFPSAARRNDRILTSVLRALIRAINTKLEMQCAKMAGESDKLPSANELLLNRRQWLSCDTDKGNKR